MVREAARFEPATTAYAAPTIAVSEKDEMDEYEQYGIEQKRERKNRNDSVKGIRSMAFKRCCNDSVY